MKDLTKLKFHHTAEKIVQTLCKKTQNINPMFFRTLVSYHICKMASMMRVTILTKDRGPIPVNLYAINLASSGQGKGHSTNIIEDQIMNSFRTTFFDETYPMVAEKSLAALAVKRATIKELDPEEVEDAVKREFESLGQLAFAFDSGTTAAVKQMRHKLLMADIGSMNLEIDEIGTNLLSNADVLGTFLELFDVGKVKQKLTKNTKENVRSEEIEGKTPTNLLLFGTPSKLLSGGKIEEEFYSFLETGYARRCLFGYTRFAQKEKNLTPKQVYDSLTDTTTNQFLIDISNDFGKLAHNANYNKVITVSEDVSILLIEYRMYCERIADDLGEHEEIRKAELAHRYFKALKLAGAYAFIDNHPEITEDNLYSAIFMVERSGEAFNKILDRDRHYVKLAKYIASIGREVTHVDLTEDLPFYKGSVSQKADLMELAIAWGYKNSVIIKRNTSSGIEFITGETLAPSDMDNIILSYSNDIADDYKNVRAPFDQLHNLMLKKHKHWVNHHISNGHRCEDNVVPGFDMVVLDIDDGATTIDQLRLLMADYKYLLYTTKRHTDQKQRFRLILPINYRLKLDRNDFKEFMANINSWLPFSVDEATGQRARKWLTNAGCYHEYGQGDKLLDAMLFIPKTSKNDERKKVIQTHQSLTNMERWFVTNASSGNRNNQLLKYALMLVDMGKALDEVRSSVLGMNKKLPDSLEDKEVEDTIMVTAARAIAKRSA